MQPLWGCNYDTFRFPFDGGRAGYQHRAHPALGEPMAIASNFESKCSSDFFQKKIISDTEYGSIPQTDANTEKYGRGGVHLGEGLGQGRWAKTRLALSSVSSWKQGSLQDLSLRPNLVWLFSQFSHPISPLHQIPASHPLWLFSDCKVFTSPVCDGLAPIYSCNRLICEEGPVIREVPESTMASQPWEQNATRPWIFIL